MRLVESITNRAADISSPDFAELQAAVKRYCLSLTGSVWDAEDLAQDTWMKAIGTLRGPGHVNAEAFLLRIAKNTWIDQSRRRSALSMILQQGSRKVASPAESSFEIELAFEALRKHLSPLQRAVFLLRDVFGYSNTEAADRLQTSEGAVKAALHRARLALHTAKDDLNQNALPIPADDGLKAYLRAMASAYQNGDISRLVQLAQQDVLEPVVAVGIVQTGLLRRRQADVRPTGQPTARLAA